MMNALVQEVREDQEIQEDQEILDQEKNDFSFHYQFTLSDSSKKELKYKWINVTITHNHSILLIKVCTFLLLFNKWWYIFVQEIIIKNSKNDFMIKLLRSF